MVCFCTLFLENCLSINWNCQHHHTVVWLTEHLIAFVIYLFNKYVLMVCLYYKMDGSIRFLRHSQALGLRAAGYRGWETCIPQLDLFQIWSIFIWSLCIYSLTQQHSLQLLITVGVYMELVWVMYTHPFLSNLSHVAINPFESPLPLNCGM